MLQSLAVPAPRTALRGSLQAMLTLTEPCLCQQRSSSRIYIYRAITLYPCGIQHIAVAVAIKLLPGAGGESSL